MEKMKEHIYIGKYIKEEMKFAELGGILRRWKGDAEIIQTIVGWLQDGCMYSILRLTREE